MDKTDGLSPSAKGLKEAFANKNLHNTDLFFYELTDSTNTRARLFAEAAEKKRNAVFIALGQSAGRGRRGRSFDSEAGAGLYISFLSFPKKPTLDAAKITAHAAVALSRAVEELTPLAPKIKWVNDLYANGRKLAGILTEGKTEDGSFSYVICGIGVNFKKRVFPPELCGIATSIEEECGSCPDIFEFAARLAELYFEENENLLSDYRERLCWIGDTVTVTKILGDSYGAKILGVTDSFSLLVESERGKEELISAEVSVKKTNK